MKVANIPLAESSVLYYISKVIFETFIALIGIILMILPLSYMIFRNLLNHKKIFVPYQNNFDLNLFVFNTKSKLVRYIPLSLAVLRNEISLIGTALQATPSSHCQPGLISLYQLRALSGINYLDIDEIDHEYLLQRSIPSDIKLAVKFVMASLLATRRRAYKPTLNLLGVQFKNTTMLEAVNDIAKAVKQKRKTNIYFVNADTLNKAYENHAFKRVLDSTKFVLPDGSGIKMACNMLNTPLKQNVNGTDLFPFLCEMAQEQGMKIFLYGAAEGIAETMKKKVQRQYPELQIVGTLNGFDLHDNEVVNYINHTKADIVLVAKGAPLQEEWIDTHSRKMTASVVMGVGGLFDFYSEKTARAPMWIREIGLEWIYRMLQEPGRMWKRYIIGNPQFLMRAWSWNRELKNEKLQYYYDNMVTEGSLLDWAYLQHKMYPYAKRVMDFTLTAIGLIMISPLLLLVAILIKVENPGPVFFSQPRVGRDGKLFNMYKFRSMVTNAEELKAKLMADNESDDGVIFKMKDDPRITKVGKFIRKWSIDELPQLFNILKGEMSLVGPRPPVPGEVREYISEDLKRLHIAPGLTCIWQISGRSDIPFKQQVDLDKKYISQRSMWTDIKILFGTIPAVLFQKGAY